MPEPVPPLRAPVIRALRLILEHAEGEGRRAITLEDIEFAIVEMETTAPPDR